MKIKNKTITTLTLIALFTGGPMAWAEAGWVSGTLDLAKVTFIPKTSFCVADVDGSRDVNYPDTTCNFSNGFALGEFYIEASQSNTDQHFESFCTGVLTRAEDGKSHLVIDRKLSSTISVDVANYNYSEYSLPIYNADQLEAGTYQFSMNCIFNPLNGYGHQSSNVIDNYRVTVD